MNMFNSFRPVVAKDTRRIYAAPASLEIQIESLQTTAAVADAI